MSVSCVCVIIFNPLFICLQLIILQVKSRNAHMKSHGKQATEKRRQREEEARARHDDFSQYPPPITLPSFNNNEYQHRQQQPHHTHPP